MNWEHVEAQWDQMKGKIREKWAKLTDDDIELIGGKKDQLVGKLRERYADRRDMVEDDVDRFISKLN